MAKAQTNTLALARIDTEEKLLDVRLRLKGKAALDLADYQRAYAATTGESVEPETLILHILAAFQTWRKANPAPEAKR